MSESERQIPTVAETEARLAQLDAKLAALEFHHTYTIADYPIGRRDRGQCELSFDHDRRGWRTMRRTTDKFGRWCKPKRGTYEPLPIVVVTGAGVSHEAGWLKFQRDGVYVLAANFVHANRGVLFQAPHWCRPHREPVTVTFRKQTITFGTAPSQVTYEDVTTPADPVALCDAWDVWERWLRDNLPAIEQRIEACVPAFA